MRVPFVRLITLLLFGVAACEHDSLGADPEDPAAGTAAPAAGASPSLGMGGLGGVADGRASAGGQAVASGVAGAMRGVDVGATLGGAGAVTAGSHAGTEAAGSSGRAPAAGSSSAGSGSDAAGGGGMQAPAAGSGGGSAGTEGVPGERPITVWIAGDSTVAKGTSPCPIGWGAEFQAHFSDKAKVVNSAVGGRSVRTWLYNVQTTLGSDGECLLAKDASGAPTLQPRWQQMLDGMQPGDYLFIQFGINDSSATCDRHVGPEAFKDSYGMMAKAAKERGAQPIFLTPVSSVSCNGSTARGTRGRYVTATQEAAQTYAVPLIDLHALSVSLYTSLGLCPIPGGGDVSATTGGKTGAFFCEDHTHFERSGAAEIAELVVGALRDQQLGLAAYLK